MPRNEYDDPFAEARRQLGVLVTEFEGEAIAMILRHADVRSAAKDWQTFSSNAPFRVPIPSEEKVRNVRQLPIETDPPNHTDYRGIVEPFFLRPTRPEFVSRISALVVTAVSDALTRKEVEVVQEFALPIQARALVHLLGVPEVQAEEWISWGTHVFRDGANLDSKKGATLDAYIAREIDRAVRNPGEDFFSALAKATFRGRPLTRDEMAGFANLAFAGGRDTIITLISGIIAYLAEHPLDLTRFVSNPRLAITATEEFVRFLSPLTHIGRVCAGNTQVRELMVDQGARVSLCWASANRDETVFDSPDEVQLERASNPHMGFGSGAHSCLGAAQARLLARCLLTELGRQVGRISIRESVPHFESNGAYQRQVGYSRLLVAFEPKRA
jgi:cytochrome P450